MVYLRAILLLTLVYLALTSNWQLNNILLGLLVATAVTLLIRPKPGQMNFRKLPGMAVALVKYIFILANDLFFSGLQVARIVLDPKLPIEPGIIAIPSDCQSELGRALSAHAITLTPGELVVEIDDNGVMYTHTLDAGQAAENIVAAQEMRRALLEKIFP